MGRTENKEIKKGRENEGRGGNIYSLLIEQSSGQQAAERKLRESCSVNHGTNDRLSQESTNAQVPHLARRCVFAVRFLHIPRSIERYAMARSAIR